MNKSLQVSRVETFRGRYALAARLIKTIQIVWSNVIYGNIVERFRNGAVNCGGSTIDRGWVVGMEQFYLRPSIPGFSQRTSLGKHGSHF